MLPSEREEVTNPQSAETMTPEERARRRRQLTEQAVKLAIESRWEEAVRLNQEYVRLFENDPEGYNRLGKALSELGRVAEAKAAYARALELDPANIIAKKNLDRLASLEASQASPTLQTRVSRGAFIEETGKSAVAVLHAVDRSKANLLDAGDPVELRVAGNAVNAYLPTGEYLGMVEPRIGLRLARLMRGGNRYSAKLVAASGDVRIMIREEFQHPSQIGKVSFPHARPTDIRAYTRPELVRADEEIELFEEDEEDILEEEVEERSDDEEAEESWSDESEAEDSVVDEAAGPLFDDEEE
jgi:tetratricopeptide (TPR) repeat protein